MTRSIFTLLLLSFLLQSCGTSRVQRIVEDEKRYTDSEIEKLAKDCKYVNKMVKKGVKRLEESISQRKLWKAESKERERVMILANDTIWANKNERRKRKRKVKSEFKQYKRKKKINPYDIPVFFRNDFLVSLLSRTNCLDGYSSEQIISIFGDSLKRPLMEDNAKFLLEYHFKVVRNEFDIMKIEFKDDKLESINIRRTEMLIISDYY